jgi:hypothetical protein
MANYWLWENSDNIQLEDASGNLLLEEQLVEFTWSGSGTATMSGAATTTTNLTIAGITKDNSGSILGSCEVFLLRDVGGNVFNFIAHTTSNAGTGAYSFTGLVNGSASYMVIAWKDNTPHVFDATDYVLQPVGV